jgi:short-chain Z-isoprenyl diphosphate synthase
MQDKSSHGATLEAATNDLSADEISKFLYTAGQPDPELLIRTSGEQRLGGFLLWQSALSEFYFCEAYWPDFRRVDFLRALRAYSQRQRRLGA